MLFMRCTKNKHRESGDDGADDRPTVSTITNDPGSGPLPGLLALSSTVLLTISTLQAQDRMQH